MKKTRRQNYSNDDYKLWEKLYSQEKKSLREIAKQTGASHTSIYLKLKYLGALRLSKSKRYSEEDYLRWIALYQQGKCEKLLY